MFVAFFNPGFSRFLFDPRVDSSISGWQYLLCCGLDNQPVPLFYVTDDGHFGQFTLQNFESSGKRNSCWFDACFATGIESYFSDDKV